MSFVAEVYQNDPSYKELATSVKRIELILTSPRSCSSLSQWRVLPYWGIVLLGRASARPTEWGERLWGERWPASQFWGEVVVRKLLSRHFDLSSQSFAVTGWTKWRPDNMAANLLILPSQ
jgi:hypothetical protein